MKLDLKLHERQAQALLTPATETLFGGAAGGGKSHLLRVCGIVHAMEVPGIRVDIFRRTYKELMGNHMEGAGGFPALLAPLVRAKKCRIVEKEIRFWNGSKIFLNHLQHEKNKYDYQGQEFHLLLFDELTHFSDGMYRYLRGRCRTGELKIPPKYRGLLPRIISGSNPGGVGHTWVKRAFRPHVSAGRIYRQPRHEGGMLRQFIPSMLADNPSQAGDYEDKLYGLGDKILVRAMLDGDWSIVAGAMFGDVWRPHLHTCDPFEIPDHWKLWRGADDGFASPASVHWFTRDPSTKTIYVIGELYRAGMRPEDFAERVKRKDLAIKLTNRTGGFSTNKRRLMGMMDSAAFGDTGTQAAISRGATMNALGCQWVPTEKWPGSRVARVQHLHRYLAPNPHDPNKRPRIRFFRGHCPIAIDVLPSLPRDEKDQEDIDEDAEDHSFDSVTYGLQYADAGGLRAQVRGL